MKFPEKIPYEKFGPKPYHEMRIAMLWCTAIKLTMEIYLGPTVVFAWDKADLQKKANCDHESCPKMTTFCIFWGGSGGFNIEILKKKKFWIIKKTPKTK